LGYEAMAGDELAAAVGEAIAANPDAWARYLAGDAKVTGFFVGQVMRATKGQADGKAVTALLQERASSATT
jgi:aspartyl-tRNA(Asn)/glutamyl-tRNA(Gln) amidotransferase subunit B